MSMISVIITVFEQTDSLIPLLYCLGNQTIKSPFEIIICDDGSSEEALRQISGDRQLSQLDIRYVWQSKNGYRAARSKNNGIRCAKGDLLVFLDGDILVRPDFLEKHLDAHQSPGQIVCNPRKWIIGEMVQNTQFKTSSRFLHELRSLAKESPDMLFSVLETLSIDIDACEQFDWSQSDSPWMSCVGFSLSLDKSNAVIFDENFEGWSPEDREFALRLSLKHGYTVLFREDIEVYHLDICSTGRIPGQCLPNSHLQIVPLLKNMLYVRDRYPHENLTDLLSLVMAYKLDPGGDNWILDANVTEKASEAELQNHLGMIETWLNHYPV